MHGNWVVADKGDRDVDKDWFLNKFADKRLSLRGVAKLLEMSPSSLSLRLDGTYKISMDEAADLARLLGVHHDEVMRRAGVTLPREITKSVKVVGTVGADGKIKKGAGETVPRPLGPQGEIVALRGQEGWLYFYSPTSRFEPDAVGRLCVWTPGEGAVGTVGGGTKGVLGILKRGSERGLWDVVPPFHSASTPSPEGQEGGVRGVKGGSATPVLMILP